MDLPALPKVSVTVDPQSHAQATYQILGQIRPQWRKEDIVIKVMSQGFVNLLLRCYIQDTKHEDGIMIRVFGENNEGLAHCFNRESEVNVMRVLAKEGIATSVYCTFNNGFAYGFAQGDTLTRESLKDDKIRNKILQLLHQIHHIDFIGYLGEVKRPGLLMFVDDPWAVIDASDFSQVEKDPRYTAGLPPLSELRKMKEEIHTIYDELCAAYPVVYSHGDTHIHNIVYDSKSDNMVFLDWEDSNWCPEIIDVTTLFDRDPEFSGIFADPASRKSLLHDFLCSHPIHGQQPISEDMLEQWYRDSLRTSLVTSFIALSFGLVSIKTSDKDFDAYSFTTDFYKKFAEFRGEIQSLYS